VPRFLEEVRVCVEGHARAGVAEDAADLDDVEADVDDQVAGEGMAEIVKAHPPPVDIEARVDGRSTEYSLGDVVVEKRRAVGGREHVIRFGSEACGSLVFAQNRSKLGEERNLSNRRARLRRDPVRRHPSAAARELVAHVNHAGGEVDVAPAQREHLREAHPGVCAGREQRPIPLRTCCEESSELCAGEDALVGAQRMRPFVALEPVERMRGDIAAAKREREHAAQGTEDPLDRPW
jgi:hypothetical protein